MNQKLPSLSLYLSLKVISSSAKIKCGASQGSIVGPLLFIFYINALPSALEYSTPIMYADDTNVSISGKSISDLVVRLNHVLNKVHHWLIANRLSVSVAKTEYMLMAFKI